MTLAAEAMFRIHGDGIYVTGWGAFAITAVFFTLMWFIYKMTDRY